MKKKQRFAAIHRKVLFITALLALQTISLYGTEALKPDKLHGVSGQVIANLLRQYHFNRQKIDDQVSSDMLDLYIEKLDRNRQYFLAADITEFEKYRYTLDDNLVEGNVDAGYIIFNVLKERVRERTEFVMQRLETEFDYTIEEDYNPDRSEAAWAASVSELDGIWRKKLKNETLNLKMAGKDWQGTQETLTKRYKNLQRNVEQYNSEDVFQNFTNALSETFDPHTNYFSPMSSQNFNIDMSLSLEGIGAQLSTEDDFTKVVKVLPGGPAEKSKQLFANDKIVGVGQGRDGEVLDVIGMRLDDVVQKIRGKKGSVVRLEVIRAEATQGSPNELITLVRDKVILEERAAKSDTVDIIHEGVEYRLGVIDIPTFYIDLEGQRRGDRAFKSTTRDVRRLIKELQAAGVDGIIIDLRRNGGGSLQEAIELTGLFIKEGPVVQVKNSAGRKRVEYDPDHNLVYDGPMSVLVSRFSASASEIFASAIQDYGRGIVVGNQTYGKGTVQNLLSLDRFPALTNQDVGQIKVTVAKFYRITGGSTQHRGVMPDIRFPSIYDEMDIGENKQFHALPWSEISPTMFKSVDNVSMQLSTLRLNSTKRTAKDREFQYLLEDIEHYKQEKDKNTISLEEESRKTKRSEQEDKKMARANERLAAKGLEPLEKGDKITSEGKAPDAVLEESQLVLADFIALSDPGRRAGLTKVNTDGKSDDETTDIKNKDKDNSKVIVH